MIGYIKQVLVLLFVMALVFAIHFFLLKSFDGIRVLQALGFPLPEQYGFQYILSVGVFLLVHVAARSYPHYVGFVFLGAVTLKFVISYLYVKGALSESGADFLRYNYLTVVVLFLFADVGLAYRVLNKSEEKVI